MSKYTFILIGSLLMLISCQEDKKSKSEHQSKQTTQVTTSSDGLKNTIPPLGQDVFGKMAAECTFIDYIWHDLPFSISQSEKSAVQNNILFISPEGVDEFPKHCKSIGRKSYQINGEIFLDADIYFGEGCNYYIFLRDEKPIYVNRIKKEGVAFYNQMFKRAMQQGQQMYDQMNTTK